MGLSCLGKRKSLRDDRFDFLLLEEIEQSHHIPSEQGRSKPFEGLDAVGDHPFAAGQKPAAGDIKRSTSSAEPRAAMTRSHRQQARRLQRAVSLQSSCSIVWRILLDPWARLLTRARQLAVVRGYDLRPLQHHRSKAHGRRAVDVHQLDPVFVPTRGSRSGRPEYVFKWVCAHVLCGRIAVDVQDATRAIARLVKPDLLPCRAADVEIEIRGTGPFQPKCDVSCACASSWIFTASVDSLGSCTPHAEQRDHRACDYGRANMSHASSWRPNKISAQLHRSMVEPRRCSVALERAGVNCLQGQLPAGLALETSVDRFPDRPISIARIHQRVTHDSAPAGRVGSKAGTPPDAASARAHAVTDLPVPRSSHFGTGFVGGPAARLAKAPAQAGSRPPPACREG